MSYKTYTTEAIVCGGRANNTSDKAFLLFTREAGMLWATARSVREERSRQRFALQDFSLIRVSLVRGKGGWKIGSVECERNYFGETDGTAREARGAITSIIRLLRQFVHGEISHPQLFEDTKTALNNSRSLSVIEIFTLRLLHHLGYVAVTNDLNDYLSIEKWYDLPALSPKTLALVDRAKQFSHL